MRTLSSPVRFDSLLRGDGSADATKLARFHAVFVPGGYAPMLDLWNDELRWFHRTPHGHALPRRGGVALRSTAEGGDPRRDSERADAAEGARSFSGVSFCRRRRRR